MATLYSHTYDTRDGVSGLPLTLTATTTPPPNTASALVSSVAVEFYKPTLPGTYIMKLRLKKPDGTWGDFSYEEIIWSGQEEEIITFTFNNTPTKLDAFDRIEYYIAVHTGAMVVYMTYESSKVYTIISGSWVSTLPTAATNPTPSDADTFVDFSDLTLSWDDGGGADTYDIYLGPVGNLSLVSLDQAETSLTIDTADVPWGQTIYWRVDATNVNGTTTGDTWSFSVVNINNIYLGSAGNFIVAVADNGVFLSTDFGDNWSRKTPDAVGTTDWTKGICSSDGTYIIVVSSANAIYRSANSGTSWAEITPADGDTFSVNKMATSDDGKYMVIVGGNSTDPTESCYISSNYGVTWTAKKPEAASVEWTDCDISNNGTIIGVTATSYFRISFDSGATWLHQNLAASAEYWNCFSLSGDGTTGLIANTNDNNEFSIGTKSEHYTKATWAESALTTAGRAILEDASAAAQATTLGLGTGDAVTHDTLTLSSIAAEATDVDKFLVDSTGVIKYRTGAQVLSDISDALDSIVALGVIADNEIIVGTGAGTYAHESGAALRTSIGCDAAGTINGANAALSNLASVAISETLVSDADNTDALGTAAVGWSDLFLGNTSVITWSTAPNTADLTLTHSANTLTFAGGTIVLGTATAAGGLTGDITGNCSGSSGSCTGESATVVNATLTTALTVNTGTLTLTAHADNDSVLTVGKGAVGVSGSNTGDQTPTSLSLLIGTNTQAWDASLDSIAALTYVSDSFIKVTAEDTYAIRTIAETADDLEAAIDHNQLANGGAHDYAYISGNDGATDVTAAQLEELTNGSETVLHSHAGGADAFTVKVDAAATAGYLGAASNDGVLRTSTGMAYADGGDFVTLSSTGLLGDGTAGRVFRIMQLKIEDGTNANTLKCTIADVWNGDTIAATDNIVKNATTGSFALSASGKGLTIVDAGLTGDVLAVFTGLDYHDASAAFNPIFITGDTGGGTGVELNVRTASDGLTVDLTAMVDDGDFNWTLISILYITDA